LQGTSIKFSINQIKIKVMEDYQSHAYNVNAAVEMLQNVDGETMELILKEIGMEWQMLRKLMLSAPMEQVEYLIEEKKDLGINC